jgi:hypothetical protein
MWAGDVDYRAVRWAGDVEYRAVSFINLLISVLNGDLFEGDLFLPSISSSSSFISSFPSFVP